MPTWRWGVPPCPGIAAEEELLALDVADAGWGLAYLDDVVAHHHPSRSRSPQSRRRHQANRVLITSLRRPARVVVKRTAAVALAGHESRLAVMDALAAVGVVLRKHRVIGPALESCVRLLEVLVASGHSRAPVANGGDLDQVVGVVHLRDLIGAGATPGA